MNVAVSTKQCNGWSNYETSLAYSWLSNDEAGQTLLRKAKYQQGDLSVQAQWLCDQYEESLYASLTYDQVFGEASLFRDLIQHAFDRINWTEIILLG